MAEFRVVFEVHSVQGEEDGGQYGSPWSSPTAGDSAGYAATDPNKPKQISFPSHFSFGKATS